VAIEWEDIPSWDSYSLPRGECRGVTVKVYKDSAGGYYWLAESKPRAGSEGQAMRDAEAFLGQDAEADALRQEVQELRAAVVRLSRMLGRGAP
jgi:hypothetical protein